MLEHNQNGASGAELHVDGAVSTDTSSNDIMANDAGKIDLTKLTLNSEHETDIFYALSADDSVEMRLYASIPAGPDGVELLRQLGFDEEQAQMGSGLLIPIYNVKGKLSHYIVGFDTPRIGPDGQPREYERPPGAPVIVDASPGNGDGLSLASTSIVWTVDPLYADSATLGGMVGLNIQDIQTRFRSLGDSIFSSIEEQTAELVDALGLDDIPQVAWIGGRKVSRLNYVFLEENWVAGNAEGRRIQRTPILHALCRALEKRGGMVSLLYPPTEYDGIPIEDKSCVFFEFFGCHRPLDLLFTGDIYSNKSERRRLKAAWRLVK